MTDLVGTWEKPLAVITGAAGGMGRTIARRLGARYRLVLVDVREDPVVELRDALAEEGYDIALATVADVGDRDSVDRLAATVAQTGTMGTVIHTAGLSPALAEWDRIVHVNLTGTAHVVDAFLPLAGSGSSAVCFASVAAHTFPASPEVDTILDEPYTVDLTARLAPLLGDTPETEFPYKVRAYGASKRGVIRLVERRVRDWAERGARIVSVSPGTVVTPMGRREHEANPLAAAAADVTPLRRRGTPADIAAAVDFLTSDLASYITGTDIRVDGGIVAARTHGV